MAETTDNPIAPPEELRRFIRAVLAASDTATLVQMVVYRGGWADLCDRVLAALADNAAACRELEDACRQTGIKPMHLRRRLEPVAEVLGGEPDDGGGEKDYFAIIGVSSDASTQEIRRAFRRRARRLHPDHGGDPQAFIGLTRAYHTLINPELRRRYEARDQQTVVAWSPPPPPARPPKPATHSFYPLLWTLPLLIIAAFALDFAYRQNTPPSVLHANRTATDADRRPAAKRIAAEAPGNETRRSVVANAEVPDAPPAPFAEDHPVSQPDARTADPRPVNFLPLAKSEISAMPNTLPPEGAMPTAGPSAPARSAPQGRPVPPDKQEAPPAAQSASTIGDYHLVLFYAPDVSRRSARELAAFLQQQGYRLSAPTAKTFAGESRVRFFHAADRPAAALLRRATRRFLRQQNAAAQFPLRLSNLAQRHPGAPRGLLELWIGPPPATETIIAPPAAGTAGKAAKPSLEERLHAFVQAYGSAYASRDVVQVAALFDADARENGSPIQKGLTIYQSHMESIKDIDYRIELDGYQQGGDSDALHIVGRFFARRELLDNQVRESRGDISMTLLPYGQSFLIKQLDYTLAQR